MNNISYNNYIKSISTLNPYDGVKSYWSMGNLSGDIVIDETGFQNATNNGLSVQTTNGINGGWLLGQNNSNNILVTSNGLGKYDDGVNWSVNMWLYKDSNHKQSAYHWSYDYTSHSDPYYVQHSRGATKPFIATNYVNPQGEQINNTDETQEMIYDSWNMLTIQRDNGLIRSYINGFLYQERGWTGGAGVNYYEQEVWIGFSNIYQVRQDWGINGNGFSDVAYWPRSISSDEIVALWNGGNGLFYV